MLSATVTVTVTPLPLQQLSLPAAAATSGAAATAGCSSQRTRCLPRATRLVTPTAAAAISITIPSRTMLAAIMRASTTIAAAPPIKPLPAQSTVAAAVVVVSMSMGRSHKLWVMPGSNMLVAFNKCSNHSPGQRRRLRLNLLRHSYAPLCQNPLAVGRCSPCPPHPILLPHL